MYEEILEKMLEIDRLNHSYCVAKRAIKLAKINGMDEKKSEIAGLLHDITKNMPDLQQLEIIKKAGIALDEIQKESHKLLHAISGSIYVKERLKIDDEEIISAIRYHTTGKANMTLLEKIIYLADFTSSDRNFEDVEYMRELVDNSLDEGLKYGLEYSIKILMAKKSKIHPDTFLAYNYYINR